MSACVGQCRKKFRLWPPTERNLRAFDRTGYGGLQLSDLYNELEGMLQVEIGSLHALRMRSGTIHEVKTLVGGFIVTKGYIDELTATPMSRWLSGSEHHLKRLSEGGRDLALENWIDAVSLACAEDVYRSWRLAANMLLSISLGSPARRKRLRNFFESVQRDPAFRWTERALKRLYKNDT